MKKALLAILWAGLIFAGVFRPSHAAAQIIAFSNITTLTASGYQEGGTPLALGLEFTVNSNIVIDQLGAFDATIGNSGAGFGSAVQVGIYSEASQSFISPTVTFLGTTGTVVESYRFQNIPSLTLQPGTYMVVACGYDLATAPDWNAFTATGSTLIGFNNGGGALTLGKSYWGYDPNSAFEPATNMDMGPYPQYGAGSFAYTVGATPDTTFNFTLDEPCKTSAGVYSTNGALLRTLWSKQRYYSAGTYSATWDGLSDASNAMPPGIYEIRLLQHNTEYLWDGAIGNSSAQVSGPTVHRGFWPMADMAISGTNGFYVSGYNEGMYDFRSFVTTSPQSVKNSFYWVYSSEFNRMNNVQGDINDLNWLWVAADSTRAYFACSGTVNPSSYAANTYPGCVVVCNVADDSAAAFTNGVEIVNNGNNSPLPSGVYIGSQPGLSGLTVQQNGHLLAASVAPDNKVYIIDKYLGSAIAQFSVPSPGRLNFSPDGSLWVISSNNVVCFTNVGTNATAILTIPNFSEPLDVAVCPTNDALILVADGGGSQQVKAFNNAGAPLWTYGLAGGYQSNGVAVATNKFWFYNGQEDGTFLCFAPDGSFWVGDGGNYRNLHFSPARAYLEEIAYQPLSWVMCVDQNNPSRVFNQFLEFSVNYTNPLSQSWTLVNNWKANVPAVNISGLQEGLYEVTTFTNGRTYGLVDNNSGEFALSELCELTNNYLRITGVYPESNPARGWISLGPDGSARRTAFDAATWFETTLSGFDASNNPVWNPETLIASASGGNSDPVPRCCSFGDIRATISSNNILIAFDQTLNNGFHLGGIEVGGTNWLWEASPAVPLMNGCGTYEIGYSVQYGGNTLQAIDRNVIYGYHGEFFRGEGQACQNMHFYDDGLFVGQFGEATPGHSAYEGALPGSASNGHYPALVKTTNGDYYLWVNDEASHGPQRWHFVNAKDIREQTGFGALGGTINLTNPPCNFPTGVVGRNGNQSGELSWLPVQNASSYNLRYSLLNGGPYSVLAGSTTNLDCVVAGLTNGQAYYFAVTAVINGVEGTTSEQAPIYPFDTTQNVVATGCMSEGGQFTPVVEIAAGAPSPGQPPYLGSVQDTGLLNPRELDYYGFGNLQNETLGTEGYVIYDWGGYGDTLANVNTPFSITAGSGWYDASYLQRQYNIGTNLGTSDGWVAYPVGTINVGVGDTNYHYLTVVSPSQYNYGRQFTMSMASTNGSSASYGVSEVYGFSHVFQFLFRGNVTLTANPTGGSNAYVEAIFLDNAWTTPAVKSTTAVASSQNPATAGAAINFTATVSGASGTPTGTVSFFDGPSNIGVGALNGSGSATISAALIATGFAHSITAVYTGDSSFGASVSSALSQVVTNAPNEGNSTNAPKLIGATLLAGGAFQFSFTNSGATSFTVLSTTNLSLPLTNWTVLGSPSNVSPGLFQFTASPATNRQSFYILRSQ